MVSFGSPAGALISEGRLPERPQMAGRPPGTGRPGAGCGRNGPGVSMLAEAASWPPGTQSHSLHPLTSGFFYLEREWERKTHAGWVWIDTTALQSSASGSCDRTGTRARTAAGLGRLRAEGRSVLVSGRRRVPTGLSLHRGRGVAGGQHRALAGGLWDPERGRGRRRVTEGAGGRAGTG